MHPAGITSPREARSSSGLPYSTRMLENRSHAGHRTVGRLTPDRRSRRMIRFSPAESGSGDGGTAAVASGPRNVHAGNGVR